MNGTRHEDMDRRENLRTSTCFPRSDDKLELKSSRHIMFFFNENTKTLTLRHRHFALALLYLQVYRCRVGCPTSLKGMLQSMRLSHSGLVSPSATV